MNDQILPELPPHAPVADAARVTKTSGLAVASLVLGLFSCGCSVFTGIPAFICGIMGLNRISRSEREPVGPRLTGQGMAITGLVLAGITTLALPIMVALLLPAVQAAKEAGRRVACKTNLRAIGMAVLQHENATGILPAAITDADGTPLLSWRVAILPYIEEKVLYDQFHLDEPWDSEHNKALIPLMPAIYACPSADLEPGTTRYLLLDGPGTAYEREKLVAGAGVAARMRGLRRGVLERRSGETIIVVEAPANRAVEWTKPEEFTVSAAEATNLAEQGGGHSAGIRHAAFADGTVRVIAPAGLKE